MTSSRRCSGRVLVPPEVLDELRSPKRPEAVRAFSATPPEWLEVRAPGAVEPIAELQAGETAAISLARECGAELLIMDETRGREAAADRGMIRLEDEFERLKGVRFWISPKLLDARLALFRERQVQRQAEGQGPGRGGNHEP